MHPIILVVLALLLMGCSAGQIQARRDDVTDRVCLRNGFPADVALAVYRTWGIPRVPEIVESDCTVVFAFDNSLGFDEGGGEVFGQYESAEFSSSNPVIRVDPLPQLIPEFRRQFIQAIAEHEFGHSQGLQHVDDPGARMYPRFIQYGQGITDGEREAMTRARTLRQRERPRPVVAVGGGGF